MSEKSVLWAPAAQQDLEAIWIYLHDDAPAGVADLFLENVQRAVSFIAAHPFGWRERPEFMPGVRAFPTHPYLVLYRVIDGVPQIVRVLHAQRDVGAALSS
jgi:toxin ParE1/3/4